MRLVAPAALASGLLALLLAGCATAPAPMAEGAPAPRPGTLADSAMPTASAAAPGPVAGAASAASAASATSSAVVPAPAETASSAAGAEPAAAMVEAAASAAAAAAATASAAEPATVAPPPAPGSLWDRLRAGFAIENLSGERVERWERHYAARPDYVERMVERGGRYLFHVVEEVERRGLPQELALLPFIESAFNPQALSRARASGMWQFMPATGREFELRQNLFRDDRRAVLASTGAALDYLQRLHQRFGDWHLALAAYNWGQGNVSRAIERNRRARKPTDYQSLRMPLETRDYVPKLQAVKNIVLDAARLGLVLPELDDHPYFTSVAIERDIDVALAAEFAGVPLADFQALNPQLNKPVILAAGTPEVLLPWHSAERFGQALAAARGPLASWTAWTAPRTMTPAEAAKAVGMSEAELREVNRIPPRMRVQAGSTLLVPRPPGHDEDVAAHVADNAQLALAPDGMRRIRVRVGPKGSSVAWVARHYGVSRVQVARWNGVSTQARFRPGQTVIVMKPLPTRSAKARPKAKPPRSAAKAGAPRRAAAGKAPARPPVKASAGTGRAAVKAERRP